MLKLKKNKKSINITNEDDDFSVDRFALEIEAERNPGLLRKYGKKLANATSETKRLKRKFELLKSEYSEIIRCNPEKYGIKSKGRPSDAVVFPLTFQFEEINKTYNNYLKWVNKEIDYTNAINTCQQRGSMIKELVKLHLNQYYSKITVKDNEVKGKLHLNKSN